MACGAQWDEYQWAASGNEKLACEEVFAHVATYGYCARSAGSCVCENPLDVTKMSARAETVRPTATCEWCWFWSVDAAVPRCVVLFRVSALLLVVMSLLLY